jgi:hypothetical protein
MDPEQVEAVARHFALLQMIEEQYGLPRDFIPSLLEETDWSFLVKLHALLEAVVSDSLSQAVDPRLERNFRRLSVSGPAGKVQFAESLGLIESSHAQFLGRLSALRNSAVHDIRRISLNLKAFFDDMRESERRQLTDSIVALFDPSIAEKWRQDATRDLKSAIWVAAMLTIACVKSNARIAEAGKELMKASLDMVQAIGKIPKVGN